MGATMKVERCSFISSGEMTRAGRVFLISRPMVGSRETKKTSKRRITTAILHDPMRSTEAGRLDHRRDDAPFPGKRRTSLLLRSGLAGRRGNPPEWPTPPRHRD